MTCCVLLGESLGNNLLMIASLRSVLSSFPSTTTSLAMGISYSTAKWVAPASFVIDFACQQYGIFSTPNMMDIHYQNLSFFSPQPQFIGAFFFPQQLFQLAWLYRLWKLDPEKPAERVELDQIVDFVPYYTLGNLCIAGKNSSELFDALIDRDSMDGCLELIEIGHLSRVCHRQYHGPIVVLDHPTAAHEHGIDFINTYTYRVQDFCRDWRAGLPAQWLGRIFQRPASNLSHQSPYWSWLWISQCFQ